MQYHQLNVFISYSKKDGLNKAKQVASIMKNAGYKIWIWYHSKTPGILTWKEIANCIIYECDVVFYLCTSSSQQSYGQGQEAGYALNNRKKVIVVALNGAKVPVELTARNYERVSNVQFFLKMQRIATELPEFINRIQKLEDNIVPNIINKL